MGRVVIDWRGVVEEDKGSGVVVDIRVAGVVIVDGLMLCKSEPDAAAVPDGLVALWREEGSLKGKTSKGEPVELSCCAKETKPKATPTAVSKPKAKIKPAPASPALPSRAEAVMPKRKVGKGRTKARDSGA